jgi:hypothetical protein
MELEMKRKQSFLLRLPLSLREQATQFAQEEGTSLNHFISLAVAERLSRIEQKRAARLSNQELMPAPSMHKLQTRLQ